MYDIWRILNLQLFSVDLIGLLFLSDNLFKPSYMNI